MNIEKRIQEIDAELAKLDEERKSLKQAVLALHTPERVEAFRSGVRSQVVDENDPQFKALSAARVTNKETRLALANEKRALLVAGGPERPLEVVEAEMDTIRHRMKAEYKQYKRGLMRLQSERDYLLALQEVRTMPAEKRAALGQILATQGISSGEKVGTPGAGKR